MAVFGPLQLTNQGQSLYTKAQTGTMLTFTRMQIGGGQLAANQDQTTLTSLISPIAYFNINSELANGSTAIIRGIFENTNLTSSTYVCEIGLFAQDPTAGEILYAYANAGTQGDSLPPISDGPISRQFNLNITVGNATNVTVNIPANTYIPVNQMGVANGIPTLDSTGKVPVGQIPPLNYVPTSTEGVANGVAMLDSNGKVPSNQLYDLTQKTNNFSVTQQFTATSASIEANQIVLGPDSKVSSPASPIYLASANVKGIGLDQYGNILPIAPSSIASGDTWNVFDKNGNKVLSVSKDGSGGVTIPGTLNGYTFSSLVWINVVYVGGFSDQNSSFYYPAQCSIDALNTVRLRGNVKTGSYGNNNPMFQLPLSMRPAQALEFVCWSYNATYGYGPANVQITNDGNVTVISTLYNGNSGTSPGTSPNWLSLDNISYKVS
jgi:hypothetical protein